LYWINLGVKCERWKYVGATSIFFRGSDDIIRARFARAVQLNLGTEIAALEVSGSESEDGVRGFDPMRGYKGSQTLCELTARKA
jgi:hypothetical protein